MDIKDVIETAIIPFAGWLSAAVFTNTKRGQRLRVIGDAFEKVSQQLTNFSAESSSKQRLVAAVRMRRFFDLNGEYALRTLRTTTCPYEKDALGVISALLKARVGDEDPGFYKALADGLAYANDLSEVDLQSADLSNAFLGRRSEQADISFKGLDFFNAKLTSASLKYARCEGAKFVQAEMKGCVLDYATLVGTDFRWANLENARFKHCDLSNAKFDGANLTGANFADADLTGATFADAILVATKFQGAKNPPLAATPVSGASEAPAIPTTAGT